MEFFVNLMRKVPMGLRFLTLTVVSVLGFILAANGLSGDGRVWEAVVGSAILLFVAGFIIYLEKNHTDL